ATYKGRIVFTRPFKEENLLTGVNNAGSFTSIGYSLLNGTYNSGAFGPVYSKSGTHAYNPDDFLAPSPAIQDYNVISAPVYTLFSIARPDGIGSQKTDYYTYENLVVHRAGRGLLGFLKVTNGNPEGLGTANSNDINLKYSLLYPFSQTIRYGLNTIAVKVTFMYFDSIPASGTMGKRYQVQTARIHNNNFITGQGILTRNGYDSYGNITQSIVTKGTPFDFTVINVIDSTVTNTSYGTYAGGPYPSFPTSVTVRKKRTGQPIVSSTTNYTYTTKGLIETITDNVGTAIATTTTNTYNDFGLPIQAVLNAPDIATPVTNYVYDATGRFLLEKKLTGGSIVKKETIAYDDRWGVPLSQTGTDGLTTSYQYDEFGQLKQTNFPDGSALTSTKSWDTTANTWFTLLSQRLDGTSPVKSYIDILGREIKTEKRGFNNQWLTSTKTYNEKGQLESETSPYYPGETLNSTTYSYDEYGRQEIISNNTGTVIQTYTESGGRYTVKRTNGLGRWSSSTTDASGQVVSSADNGVTVDFAYDSWGNQLTVGSAGKVFVTNVYDAYGRRAVTTDANAKVIHYTYNALGQIVEQKDANNNIQGVTYDVFGRVATTTGAQGTTSYTYYSDAGSGKSNNNITRITGFSGDVRDYGYDILQRLAIETITASGSSMTKTYTYDNRGNLATTSYPAGFTIRNEYDNNDIVTQTKYEQGATIKTLFTATAMNSRGVYTGFNTGNGKASTVTWDYSKELPSRYYTAGIQDLNMVYETNTNNLLSRKDAIKNLTEDFVYDVFDRLISSRVNGTQQFGITYDTEGQGKILQKSDIGNYNYNISRPHALATLSPVSGGANPGTIIGVQPENITYTAFLKASTITENGSQLAYTYGADQQRLSSTLSNSTGIIETKSYWGNIEGITKAGVSSEIYYIAAGNKLNNIIVKQSGVISIFYAYTDQLGSILTLTNESGVIIAAQNFDAWGRKRNPNDWSYTSIPVVPDWLYRGYTGHEHVAAVGTAGIGLINMNGRMYDPALGMMMAPDIFVQYPFRPGGYNRYLYANGNPLKFTDPGGWLTRAEFGDVISTISEWTYGGYWNDASGIHQFGSGDRAFGAGVGYMGSFGVWGAYNGYASSANAALNQYNGGVVTRDMVAGYYQYQWRNTTRYEINAKYAVNGRNAGLGFNVGWRDYGGDIPTVGAMFVSWAKIDNLITEFRQTSTAESYFLATIPLAGRISNVGGAHPFARTVTTVTAGAVLVGAAAVDLYKYNQRPGVQYALRATKSGQYPVFVWGSLNPINSVHLDAGEIWKIGRTTQYDVLTNQQWRYSQTELNRIGLGVFFDPEFRGSNAEIWMAEKMKLWNYIYANGELPPGNKVPW
ncbi:MAG TPA: RHS repeat-associated core domain-containing protein, partial [Niabella sp.]|nr:RHS repeat-associated core domain-containing protein [Niabella sp.]